jgi:NTP pyrophosphatase (non-canonical NTP hydrolase)
MLNDLGKAAYDNAVAHGFYEEPPSVPERLCLIHSEVSEALEDYRDGNMEPATTESGKPIGFPSELADALIRIVDLAYYKGIDLDEAVRVKMAYNITRPFKHGRKVL